MKLKTIKTILSHPLNQNNKISALVTFFTRGVIIRLHRHPIVYPFVENTSLVVEKGMSSAELQIYTGLYDLHEMFFLMHYLRPEDTFVDVGANVGVYTVLAAGVAGSKAISFEPIPSTYSKLLRNVVYNGLQDRVELLNMGVGDKEEQLVFSNSLDATNHVINTEENFQGATTKVSVNSLDHLLADKTVSFLKIDVEGFEANVINGAPNILNRSELKVIIMETNGLSDQYEFGQNYLHDKLLGLGFLPYSYDPFQRNLQKLTNTNPQNTIYLRDIDFVRNRIQTSRKINFRKQLI
ncbi:FkbM family methyltransferase [Dyadobacter sp. CY261]|uniref:FkbM family methyltransferase n=1 Tax=Dyadobacter sp. CY261 TaxID=2907203 RepID=UPI001F027A52|nr:FkbM family methyltransferase [Dyadobacter sp. CY261]MCF0073416.1 FkbM family methyltransferase [Dyadobacter sp. CY261]